MLRHGLGAPAVHASHAASGPGRPAVYPQGGHARRGLERRVAAVPRLLVFLRTRLGGSGGGGSALSTAAAATAAAAVAIGAW